jgi:GNAT superfamily N-acetyltransferase
MARPDRAVLLGAVNLTVASLAERPDLAPLFADFPGAWPEFMHQDPVSPLLYDAAGADFAPFCLVAWDEDAPERAVARACSLPFTWAGDPDHDLPAGGYDAVILSATHDRLAGRRGNLVAAVEVLVRPDLRGRGLSGRLVEAVRRNAARLGYGSVVVPVRPNGKHAHQDMPMTGYARWTRDDGLPVDPWLRVHVRAGARIVGVAPRSMTLAGTLDEWREWTGLPFDVAGPVKVPEALVPVHCDLDQGYAVYVEPNVWVHHRL